MEKIETKLSWRYWALYLLLSGIGLSLSILPLKWHQFDVDFWWHMADGRYIAIHHTLMSYSHWLFGQGATHKWTMAEWGSELWMYLVGVKATLIIYLAMVMGISVIGLYRLWGYGVRRIEAFILLPIIMTALALAVLEPRDELQSTLVFAITVLCLEKAMQGKKTPWFILPPLFFLNVNLHPAFFISPGIWGFTLLVWWISIKCSHQPLVSFKTALKSTGWFVISGLATFINPYNYRIWLYTLHTLNGGVTQIEEWMSPNFHWIDLLPVAILIAVIPFAWVKLNIVQKLWISFAIAGTLYGVRNLQLAIALILPILAYAWYSQIKSPDWYKLIPQKPPLAGLAILLLSLIVITGISFQQTARYINNPFQTIVQPVAPSMWFKQHHINHQKLFISYSYNGYFIYHNPTDKVWLYGDVALIGDNMLTEYASIDDLSPNWERLLLKINPNYIVWPANHPLALILQKSTKNFRMVFNQSGWQIFQVIHQ